MAMPDRDEKGRFKTGNKGGPGRPRLQLEEFYFRALTDGVTETDLREGAKQLARKIARGDVATWKMLMPYLVGLPIQRQEHSGGDSPIRIIFEYADDESTSTNDAGHES